MIPNAPISPLFKSNLFSLDWYNEPDDVFLEANTNPYSSRTEINSRTLTLFNPTTVQNSEGHCNLQVVPEIDSIRFDSSYEGTKENSHLIPEFAFYVTSPKEKRTQLSDCMFSRVPESRAKVETLTLPQGPTRKLSESEIELLKLLSPSIFGKSPKFSFASSRDSRNSSEDLSVYLPENFTPAPVEILESSLEETVFRFPGVVTKEDGVEGCKQRPISTRLEPSLEEIEVKSSFFEELVENVTENRKRKASSAKQTSSRSPTSCKRRKAAQKPKERLRKTCTYLDDSELRNKMERDRRTELNSKFDNLRDNIPDLEGNNKASKICILGRAASFCVELRQTDELLQQEKIALKKQNNELWNRLMKLSSN